MTIKTSQLDWLRNDYITDVTIGGILYPTAEHAYQAAKTNNFEIKRKIAASDITEARRLGKSIDLDDNWEDKKSSKMLLIIRQKFMQNAILAGRLMNLGDEVIEADMRDEFWGTGRSGFGENSLGDILASVRDEIQDINGFVCEKFVKEPTQEDIERTLKYYLESESDGEFTRLVMELYTSSGLCKSQEQAIDNLNKFLKEKCIELDLVTEDEEEIDDDEEEIDDDDDDYLD